MRGIGIFEGVTFLLLMVAMPLKYLADIPGPVRIFGSLHGGAFIVYMLAVLVAAYLARWRLPLTALALAAGFVPLGTFFLEAKLRRDAVSSP